MTSPFEQTDPWDPDAIGGAILPAGEHAVYIMKADASATSSGGYPQVIVNMANDQGEITDWIVVIDSTIGRVNMLTDAAGLPRIGEGDFVPEGQGYRISQTYADQLLSKSVIVVVRDEPDYKDASRTRQKVAGYRQAGDVPAAVGAKASSSNDESIPF